jgi:hypothetical protein
VALGNSPIGMLHPLGQIVRSTSNSMVNKSIFV